MTPAPLPPKVKLHSNLVRSSLWQVMSDAETAMLDTLWGIAGGPTLDGDRVVLYCSVTVRRLQHLRQCSRRKIFRALDRLRGLGLISTASTGRGLAVALFPPTSSTVAPLFAGVAETRRAVSTTTPGSSTAALSGAAGGVTRGTSEVSPVAPQRCHPWHLRGATHGTSEVPPVAPLILYGASASSLQQQQTRVSGEVLQEPAAAAGGGEGDGEAERRAALIRLRIGEPVRSELLRLPGLDLAGIERGERKWRSRREHGRAGTGMLIAILRDEAEATRLRRRRQP